MKGGEPRDVVERGFDAVAELYLEWTTRIEGDPRVAYLERLSSLLPDRARILELGCGAGEPSTRLLAERFRVTGVDVSARQIALARARVPGAEFVQADFTELNLAPASFDAVAAFYALNHVPRDRLGALFVDVHSWLAPGGLFLASLGTSDEDARVGEWLGTTMFFSGWDATTNRSLLQAARFELLVDELVTVREPEPDGEATFEWVLARR